MMQRSSGTKGATGATVKETHGEGEPSTHSTTQFTTQDCTVHHCLLTTRYCLSDFRRGLLPTLGPTVHGRVWDELTTFSVFGVVLRGLLSRTGFWYKTQALCKKTSQSRQLAFKPALAPPPPFQAAQLPQLCAQDFNFLQIGGK